MRMPTEQEFFEWITHPVTIAAREAFHKKRETLRQQWEGGSFTDYAKEATILTNVANMGICKGLATFTDLDYEQLLTELEDDGQPKRPTAPGSGSAD